jgi:hypothetical protein
MCTVLLPLGVNPIAVNKYVSFHNIASFPWPHETVTLLGTVVTWRAIVWYHIVSLFALACHSEESEEVHHCSVNTLMMLPGFYNQTPVQSDIQI